MVRTERRSKILKRALLLLLCAALSLALSGPAFAADDDDGVISDFNTRVGASVQNAYTVVCRVAGALGAVALAWIALQVLVTQNDAEAARLRKQGVYVLLATAVVFLLPSVVGLAQDTFRRYAWTPDRAEWAESRYTMEMGSPNLTGSDPEDLASAASNTGVFTEDGDGNVTYTETAGDDDGDDDNTGAAGTGVGTGAGENHRENSSFTPDGANSDTGFVDAETVTYYILPNGLGVYSGMKIDAGDDGLLGYIYNAVTGSFTAAVRLTGLCEIRSAEVSYPSYGSAAYIQVYSYGIRGSYYLNCYDLTAGMLLS